MTETEALNTLHSALAADAHFTVHYTRSSTSRFAEAGTRPTTLACDSMELWTICICDGGYSKLSSDVDLADCVKSALSHYASRHAADEKPSRLLAPSRGVDEERGKQAS
jgi:hypothetical protein